MYIRFFLNPTIILSYLHINICILVYKNMIVSIFNYHFILSYYHVIYHMLLSLCWGKISVDIIE